jgi:3-hydroxybutyryl-CoA dehydrogenase
MYREALSLVESGVASVEDVDRSMRNALGLWATICGPFRWIDLTGGLNFTPKPWSMCFQA